MLDVPAKLTAFRVCVSRPAVLDAWPRVLPLVERIAAEAADDSYRPEDLRDALARGEQWLLLMEDGAELQGFAVLQPLEYPRHRMLREAHIYLLPEHRGRGLFDQYLAFLRLWAVEHDFAGTTVSLPATAEPRWRPLMERSGFHVRTIEYVWEAP